VPRASSIALYALLAAFAARPVRAEEPKPAAPNPAAPKPVPSPASSAEAKAAIGKFKEAFKGKDSVKKAAAVDALGRVNHPDVVTELMRLVRHRDPEIRAAAFQNLGAQRAIPSVAGGALVATVDVKSTDWQHLTDVVDAVEQLQYRGSLPTLVKLLHHGDQSVVRWSLDAIGDLKDVRGLDAILDLMKELKIDEGVKWEGGEVSVDTGTAGDGDQRAAEAAYAARYGNNAAKGKAAGRKMRALGEILYLVLKDLTGESFHSGKAAREWVAAHAAELAARKKALDEEQKRQDEAGKAAVAAARAGR
jgi:hypothetical protein